MATGCRTCSILKGYFLKADMWACFIGMCPPSMCRPLQRKWIWFKNIPTADDSRCSHAIDNVWTGCALVFTHTISQTFWWNVAIMNSSPKIRLNTIFSPFSQILMLILMVQAFCLLQPLHTSILLETFSPCSAPMEMYPPRPSDVFSTCVACLQRCACVCIIQCLHGCWVWCDFTGGHYLRWLLAYRPDAMQRCLLNVLIWQLRWGITWGFGVLRDAAPVGSARLVSVVSFFLCQMEGCHLSGVQCSPCSR